MLQRSPRLFNAQYRGHSRHRVPQSAFLPVKISAPVVLAAGGPMPRKTSEARLAPVPDPAPRRLLITSPKGGVGKTGLSSNLSVAAALEGLRVAALDFDRQRSFARWWQRRPEGTAPIDLVEGDLRDLTGIEQIGWGCDLLVI